MTLAAPNGVPADPQSIPNPALLLSPAPESTVYYRDFPPRIGFTWERAESATRYHIQVANDLLFHERVLDEYSTRSQFVFGNLRAGSYYWRVSVVRSGGVEGTSSEPRPITVVQDQKPPRLVLLAPGVSQPVRVDRILVRGQSEAGAKVYINGKPAEVEADGSFARTAALKTGVNVIVVEAVDPAGNTSYQSRIVNRKP